MCHSSSDVLARPRRPPPESSVESSAPESAKLFLRVAESCGVAHQSPPPSPVGVRQVPARVVLGQGCPPSPPAIVRQVGSSAVQGHPPSSPGSRSPPPFPPPAAGPFFASVGLVPASQSRQPPAVPARVSATLPGSVVPHG